MLQPPDETPGTPSWNPLAIGRFNCVSSAKEDWSAECGSCEWVDVGTVQERAYSIQSMINLHLEGWVPALGQGPALWERYQDVQDVHLPR